MCIITSVEDGEHFAKDAHLLMEHQTQQINLDETQTEVK